jgi:hypothetical protein
MNRVRSKFFPDLPTIYEAVQLTDDQKWWFDFRSNVDNLGRILIGPPGIPQARLDFLQKAVKQALTDQALIEDGEHRQLLIDYDTPQHAQEMATAVLTSLTAAQKARMKAIIGKTE